jgi:hypothetical protein
MPIPPALVGCDPSCICGNCDFTYKRWEHVPTDLANPDVVYRQSLSNDTLHVSESGYVLVGGSLVYAPGSTTPYISEGDIPELPDENAKWLWISENFASEGSGGWVSLYAVRASLLGQGTTFDLRTNLKVWRWDQNTDTSTLIIDKDFTILRAATTAKTYIVEAGWINPGIWHLQAQFATEGNFDDLPSSKWGDVRHDRIVIAGTACWYNEGSNAEYDGNSEINCWDLDGVLKWSTNLGDHYGQFSDGVPTWDSSDDTRFLAPYDTQNHYMGFPKVARLRIGEDKSLHVTTVPSRAVEDFGFKWSDYYGFVTEGAAAIPCHWYISEDITATVSPVLSVTDWAVYGCWDGIDHGLLVFSFFEDADDAAGGPIITVDRTETGFEIGWNDWDSMGGSLDPADYYLKLHGPLGGPVTLAVTETNYLDEPSDHTTSRTYRIDYHLTADDSILGTGNNVFVGNNSHLVRRSHPRDMDVSALGNAFLSLETGSGPGLVKIVYDPTPFVFDDSETNDDGYRSDGFEETHRFVYNEGTAEYAGPVWFDEYTDNFPEPSPPRTGDGNDVWVLRAGANGTYLVRVDLGAAPIDPYEVNRIWSCSLGLVLRLERAQYQSSSSSLLGHLHTMSQQLVTDSDSPCPACDSPVDDPCTDCTDKTRKVGWELLDHPLLDDAWLDHAATKFMQCQLLFPNQTINGVPADEICNPNYNFYGNWPIRFRPYGEDCQWQLCGRRITVCQDGFDDNDQPAIFCNDSGIAFANMGKVLVGSDYKFRMWAWLYYRDPDTDTIIGPTQYVVWETDDVGEICGPNATFRKITDLSQGEVLQHGDGTPYPYYGLPYFRDTIRAKRVHMDTLCDIPPEPEPEPWCWGDDTDPPETLCYGVEVSPGATVSEPEYPGEPTPPDLDFNGTNTWSNGSATLESNCDPVIFTWGFDFTLVISDVNDPGATWQLQVDWSTNTGGPTTTGTAVLSPVPNPTCPPVAMTFELDSASLISGTLPPFVDCNAVSFDVQVNIFECPEPIAMMATGTMLVSKPKVERKTPEEVPCLLRGGYLRTSSCCGDLYQCKSKEVFEETKSRSCTINNNISGYQSCLSCPHRRTAEPL